jgi:hypothetical protein
MAGQQEDQRHQEENLHHSDGGSCDLHRERQFSNRRAVKRQRTVRKPQDEQVGRDPQADRRLYTAMSNHCCHGRTEGPRVRSGRL